MSHAYRAVGWNPQKVRYDLTIGACVAASLSLVGGGTALLYPSATLETILLRALAVTAFALLHVILCIGPACRLDRRFLPLLYNRRHLGVTMCLLALSHAILAVVQFHAFGNVPPLESLLTTSAHWTDPQRVPFQIAGACALAILVVMAATSHDFWLRTLTAPVWKALHMGVYVAYVLLVVHVAFGALRDESRGWMFVALALGGSLVAGLHVAAARREAAVDEALQGHADARLVSVCRVDEIRDLRARVACVAGERIAVFRYGDRVSAISNVCQHQNGPLGEGKIVRGCVVCPWHGYEYDPASGASPPPFTERVPTFRVSIRDGWVLVDPRPLPPGTFVEPARITP